MAKKEKLHFQYSDDLEAVDAELADAMELLDQTNERVSELLREFGPAPEPSPTGAAAPETSGAVSSSPAAEAGEPDPATGT